MVEEGEVLEGPSTAGQCVDTARTALGMNEREKGKRGVRIGLRGLKDKNCSYVAGFENPVSQQPRAVEELTKVVGRCDVFRIILYSRYNRKR
jgi:hypothetical protein